MALKISDFTAGHFQKQAGYRSFSPAPINHEWLLNDTGLIALLSEADRGLGQLQAYSKYIPNIDFYIEMHLTAEATKSSKIEGTQTNIEEAILKEEDVEVERREDWSEVQNYISAMHYAKRLLQDLPVSTRLMKEVHKVLLQGVRGENKLPGEFRRSQNWIGGSSIQDAVFIPPLHSEVNSLMSDLETFLNRDDLSTPPLIRIAIAHYQFETIHPFLDGNGRLGRLLIPLYLMAQGILNHPILYISDFFEKNRTSYYDSLNAVRTRNAITEWLRFFLTGVIYTTNRSASIFQKVLELEKEMNTLLLRSISRARMENATKLMDSLYRHPYLSGSYVEHILEVSAPTANKYIEDFVKAGIVEEATGRKRDRIFIFRRYINLF